MESQRGKSLGGYEGIWKQNIYLVFLNKCSFIFCSLSLTSSGDIYLNNNGLIIMLPFLSFSFVLLYNYSWERNFDLGYLPSLHMLYFVYFSLFSTLDYQWCLSASDATLITLKLLTGGKSVANANDEKAIVLYTVTRHSTFLFILYIVLHIFWLRYLLTAWSAATCS